MGKESSRMENMVTADFWRGKRVLVTGHTGFKGAWLSLWLKLLGAEVIGYSLAPPSQPNLFEALGIAEEIIHFYSDVRDIEKLQKVFREYKPDLVFHLAAQSLVRLSYREPHLTYETNIMGTVNVLEAVRQTPGVKSVVIATSDKCYENREWLWGYREQDNLGGNDPYSSSKAAAEIVTGAYLRSYFPPETYNREHQVGLASVRAGNVIGGGDWGTDRLIPDCIKAFHRKEKIIIRYPDAVRPWQYVLEPLRGYLMMAAALYQEGPQYSGAWNFGPDDNDCRPVKWVVQYMCQMWSHETGWSLDPAANPQEAHFLKLDCSKARMCLGWQPKLKLAEALKWTVDWYLNYYKNVSLIRSLTEKQIMSYQEL
jgi:CDP-glucose 4,6-dehydratase